MSKSPRVIAFVFIVARLIHVGHDPPSAWLNVTQVVEVERAAVDIQITLSKPTGGTRSPVL